MPGAAVEATVAEVAKLTGFGGADCKAKLVEKVGIAGIPGVAPQKLADMIKPPPPKKAE